MSMKNEMQDENNKLIHTGNSGEVYYSEEGRKLLNSKDLGAVECKTCKVLKPFEQVRWDTAARFYVCLDCLRKEG